MGKSKELQTEMEDVIHEVLDSNDLLGIDELRTQCRSWHGYSVEVFNAALNDLIARGEVTQSGLFYSLPVD